MSDARTESSPVAFFVIHGAIDHHEVEEARITEKAVPGICLCRRHEEPPITGVTDKKDRIIFHRNTAWSAKSKTQVEANDDQGQGSGRREKRRE